MQKYINVKFSVDACDLGPQVAIAMNHASFNMRIEKKATVVREYRHAYTRSEYRTLLERLSRIPGVTFQLINVSEKS